MTDIPPNGDGYTREEEVGILRAQLAAAEAESKEWHFAAEAAADIAREHLARALTVEARLATAETSALHNERAIIACNQKISEVELWNKDYREQLAVLKGRLATVAKALEVDPNNIWEAYMDETPVGYRTPQGAIAYTVDRLQGVMDEALTDGAKP